MADMPGATPNKLVLSKLSTLLAPEARVWCTHTYTECTAHVHLFAYLLLLAV